MCVARVANTSMVPSSNVNAKEGANTSKGKQVPSSPAKSSSGSPSTSSKTVVVGLPLVRKQLARLNIPQAAQDVIMASWRQGTVKQYTTYLSRWEKFCNRERIDVFAPGLTKALQFFNELYNSGLGHSAINTARSALSTIITPVHGVKFGEIPLVTRFLKGVYELKPSFPKYSTIWDVRTVLTYLKQAKPLENCSLKDLTLKLTMLLCLVTGQRCQTIHAMDSNYIQILPDRCRITIVEKLKHTKVGHHQAPLDLLSYPQDKDICVVEHLKEYIQRTGSIRNQETKLLLSYIKPHKRVSKDTVARWVKQVLKDAGIDSMFTAHSSRAASTSYCRSQGLNLNEIMKSAGWSNAVTFGKFYNKPIVAENFGATILEIS